LEQNGPEQILHASQEAKTTGSYRAARLPEQVLLKDLSTMLDNLFYFWSFCLPTQSFSDLDL
jgi:hypothetical protein